MSHWSGFLFSSFSDRVIVSTQFLRSLKNSRGTLVTIGYVTFPSAYPLFIRFYAILMDDPQVGCIRLVTFISCNLSYVIGTTNTCGVVNFLGDICNKRDLAKKTSVVRRRHYGARLLAEVGRPLQVSSARWLIYNLPGL